MKTEREMFEAYFKTVWKGIDLIQTIGEDFAFKLLDGKYVEDIVEDHWRTWQASATREGYKLIPVEQLQAYVDSIRHYNETGDKEKIEYDLSSIEHVFTNR